MGRPVVHFEVMGKEAERLQSFYSQLFDWRIHADNEMGYGLVAREGNTKAEGAAIGGGVGAGPDGYDGHVTFYVEVPDALASSAPISRRAST
jgi:predicted enzyme related to lactoylglutathione lyase